MRELTQFTVERVDFESHRCFGVNASVEKSFLENLFVWEKSRLALELRITNEANDSENH